MPGYITQFTTTFTQPGDYLIVCHEFCGNGHHVMSGRLNRGPIAGTFQNEVEVGGGRARWPAATVPSGGVSPV